ncbi:MAG: DUF721 domain-containing protein [Rhodocyclaceae bacterium]|nr:DUF721 domain-containing protein [Rhodocyclaceae bacterium]
MQRGARSLDACLKADDGLARLTGHADRLLRMQRLFEAATPLSSGARIANLKSGKIVIHAANGAVAAKLKQIAPTLADVFRFESAEVTGIEIRVQPRVRGLAKPAKFPRAIIGENQKRGLTSLASSLPEGSPLRAAVTRLVSKN